MTDLQQSPNLLLAMDCLWFQQKILFSEPISLPIPKPSSSQTSLDSQSYLSTTPPLEEQSSFSSDTSPTSPKDGSTEDDTEVEDDEQQPSYNYKRKRSARVSLVSSRTCSFSSSPSVHRVPKHLRGFGVRALLTKTTSCKSLFELEYEEVKGFMDLGFKFNKEQLCPRMMSVLPGLQRLDEYEDGIEGECFDVTKELKDNQSDEDLDGKKKGIMRPYLSEAWLIKRPDSPLLNMRIPPVSKSDDMKKHLKCWARTVASAIQLEY